MLYRTYTNLLQYYNRIDASFPSIARFLIEKAAISLVLLGSPLRGWRFPARAIGGWWWIWRYRWEVIAGWLEYDTLQWCRRLIRPGMRSLDIGAHIGYYSRLLSDLVGSTGEVLAYEPSPENYPILLTNLRQARYGNISPFNLAITDRRGMAKLFVSPGHSNHSLKSGYTEHQSVLEVETVSIDDHLKELNVRGIDFAKIDTEGSEIEVLEGMRHAISESPGLIMVVELNPRALQAGGHAPKDLLELLSSLGFIPREISSYDQLLDPDPNQVEETMNLLCMWPDAWDQLGY